MTNSEIVFWSVSHFYCADTNISITGHKSQDTFSFTVRLVIGKTQKWPFGTEFLNGCWAIINACHPFLFWSSSNDAWSFRHSQPISWLNRPDVFFDNPGGTQIAKPSLDRVNRYLIKSNANREGVFATSIASNAVLDEAHRAMADFYNAASLEETVFGNNMTTLTLHISRSPAREWQAGDEIVVTRLDHDANVTP